MDTIKIWSDNPSERQLDEIVSHIEAGEVVLMPTDTTYAMVCDALIPKAIERVCRLKGINPEKQHLSILCADIAMAAEYSRIPDSSFRLIRESTPGAYTFLLKAVSSLPKAFKGRKVVGIRIPDSNTVRRVVERLGHPLMSASIEYEDEDHAINPELIAETYEGKADIMVDGGDGSTHISAIYDCTGNEPELVREAE